MKTEIGGTQSVNRAGRVNIQATQGFNDTGVSDLANNINDLVGSVGKAYVRQKVVRDAEDRMGYKTTALQDSQDISNAMQGASQDPDLNDLVTFWRGEGRSDTEVRNKSREYKLNKAYSDFEAEGLDDEGEGASLYTETLTSLELKELEPLAKIDRARELSITMNKMNASLVIGDEPLAVKFKDAVAIAEQYGIDPAKTNAMVIGSAFMKYQKYGDTSAIEELETLKTANGIRVIDTIEGQKMHLQMLQAKEARDYNLGLKAEKEKEAKTVEVTNTLYNSLINDDTYELTVANIDAQLDNKTITSSQHSMLRRTAENLDPQGKGLFPDNSNGTVYSNLYGKAQLGILSQEELISMQSELKWEDYKTITNLAIQKGGIDGVDNELSRVMDEAIDDFSIDYAGINLMSNLESDIDGLRLGKKRASMLEERLTKAKYAYVRTHGELPDEATFNDMKNKVLEYTDATLGKINEDGLISRPMVTLEQNMEVMPSNTNEGAWQEWYNALSPKLKKEYRAYRANKQ